MKCENCGKREATVRYSENINGRKKELHLCEQCSRELGIDEMDFNMPINLSNFLAGLIEEFEKTDFMPPMFDEVKDLRCSSCGYTFDDILNTGKLGCANCYDVFGSRLDPIIRKIQGSDKHVGRIGKITEGKVKFNNAKTENTKAITEIEKLKQDLKKAVKEENYEEAAKLRDEIAKKEKGDK